MMAKVCLGPEELRIIGHAINWRLNLPYENTSPSRLSEEEANTLSRILADLSGLIAAYWSGARPVEIELGDSCVRAENRLLLSPSGFRLVIGAVASFIRELGSSPTEMEVVTGAPWSKTPEVLSRLQALSRPAAG